MSDSRSETSFSEAWVIGLTLVAVLAVAGFSLNEFLARDLHRRSPVSSEEQQAHSLALALFCYANDHANKYSHGKKFH